MDGFGGVVVFILIIVGIVNSISKSAKKAGQKSAGPARPAGVPQQGHSAPAAQNAPAAVTQPAQTVRQQPAQTVSAPHVKAAPAVRPTLHDHKGMFDGSLMRDDESPEGRDPHDHGFSHEVHTPSMTSDKALNASLMAERHEAGAAPVLNLTPQSIREAFVLQEVLKRRGGRR